MQTGLAVALLDKLVGELWWPAYPQYLATFESIFVHYPRIKVFTVEEKPNESWGSPSERTYDEAEAKARISGGKILRYGIYNGGGCWEDFSKQFYHDAAIPYETRWDCCPIQAAAKSFNAEPTNRIRFNWPLGKGRVFLHEDLRRGYRITKALPTAKEVSIFRPPEDKIETSILGYVPLIETAEEIHCIDSAFFHLINSLTPVGQLYLHKYPRWPRSPLFRYPTRLAWNYID